MNEVSDSMVEQEKAAPRVASRGAFKIAVPVTKLSAESLAVSLGVPIHSAVLATIVATLFMAFIGYQHLNKKKYRHNKEHGSARFGNKKDAKNYIDPKPENNIILTQTESLTMNSRPKPVKYPRNKNILIIGGSGSGKTRFYVKPNLMQCESQNYPVSFCITDPKGLI